MTQSYECEVRIFIKDISLFENKLKELGGRIDFEYEFTDYYYKPKSENWNPTQKNIRIRSWKFPVRGTYIALVKNKIIEGKLKQSEYKDGKIKLYTGTLGECKDVLEDLNFKEWFPVRKQKAKIWDVNEFKTAVEYIEEIGWTAEIEFEGTDLSEAIGKIDNALSKLGIKEGDYTFKTISRLVAEAKGLL